LRGCDKGFFFLFPPPFPFLFFFFSLFPDRPRIVERSGRGSAIVFSQSSLFSFGVRFLSLPFPFPVVLRCMVGDQDYSARQPFALSLCLSFLFFFSEFPPLWNLSATWRRGQADDGDVIPGSLSIVFFSFKFLSFGRCRLRQS